MLSVVKETSSSYYDVFYLSETHSRNLYNPIYVCKVDWNKTLYFGLNVDVKNEIVLQYYIYKPNLKIIILSI